jgi:hypothetical protein
MTDQDQDTSPRQRAIEAYESARDGVTNASRKAVDTLAEAPLIALAGGIAAGALVAALLPRTASEAKLVRPASRRVRNTAQAAYSAAREAGSGKLDELGINRDNGESGLRKLFEGVSDAVRASADAALDAARKQPR